MSKGLSIGRSQQVKVPSLTIFNLLDAWLQGDLTVERINTLTLDDFDDLADRLDEFYSSVSFDNNDGELFYSGGWIAGNWGAADVRQYLYSSCLYYPQVAVHDPLAEWFFLHGDRLSSLGALRSVSGRMSVVSGEPDLLKSRGYLATRSELSRVRTEFATRLSDIKGLRSLIESGVVVLISPWHIAREREQSILTAVRHDVRDDELYNFMLAHADALPRADQLRGGSMKPDEGWDRRDIKRAAIQDPSYFYNKTLAISDSIGAKYIPPDMADSALLELKLRQLGGRLAQHDVDLKVVPGIAAADLPFFKDLTSDVLVTIRRDEEAFEDWRRGLRNSMRIVEGLPSRGDDFEIEARQVLSDSLIPLSHEVAQLTARSPYLKKVAGESLLSIGTAVAATVAVQHVMNVPNPDPAAVPVGITTGALSWLFRSVFRGGADDRMPQLVGSKAVMATLVQKR